MIRNLNIFTTRVDFFNMGAFSDVLNSVIQANFPRTSPRSAHNPIPQLNHPLDEVLRMLLRSLQFTDSLLHMFFCARFNWRLLVDFPGGLNGSQSAIGMMLQLLSGSS